MQVKLLSLIIYFLIFTRFILGGISDVCIIERNYCSSLIAFVSLHSPRKLVLYNYTKGAEIADKHFPNTVLSVKLNRKVRMLFIL